MNLEIKTTKIFNDINENHRIIMLRGGSRSSKTYTAVQYLIVQALSTPNVVCSIVRKSLPSLRKSVFRDFKEIMINLNVWNESNYMATNNYYLFDNGSIIEFFSVADSERIKGTKRNYLLIDEANELSYDDFTQLFIRTTNKTIVAFNPSFHKDTHWLYTSVYNHPDCIEYISTYKDNPFIDEGIKLELQRLEKISESYYRIYALGEFGSAEGVILDNFEIINEMPEEGVKLLGYGQDLGFSQDPTAVVAIFKYEDSIIVKELLYQTGLLTSDLAAKLKQLILIYGNAPIVSDVDNRLITELQRYGLPIKAANKIGINLGIDVMKQYKILITKDSKNLINELYNYTWMKNKAGEYINTPTGGNDHAIDATRYIFVDQLSKGAKKTGVYTFEIF